MEKGRGRMIRSSKSPYQDSLCIDFLGPSRMVWTAHILMCLMENTNNEWEVRPTRQVHYCAMESALTVQKRTEGGTSLCSEVLRPHAHLDRFRNRLRGLLDRV